MILAGHGTWLRPLTERIRQPMTPVGGRTLLEHTIEQLSAAGVEEVAVNLHERAGAISDKLGDGSGFGVKITYSFEPQSLGTAGALKALDHFFSEGPFFVIYGDVQTCVDLRQLLDHHRSRRALATIVLRRHDDVRQAGIVRQDEEGWIADFIDKPESVDDPADAWANGGVCVVEAAVLRHIKCGVEQDFSRDVFPTLVRSGRAVAGFRSDAGR